MASRERLCDYFAVVGVKESDVENRVVADNYSIGNLHRALEEAIVDICIVNHSKDTIPFDDNYELLLKPDQADEGMEGGKVQLAKHLYLCFRRRKHNKTSSYITEVKLFRKGQDILEEGYELIEKTVGGGSADLTKGLGSQTYLAVKRATVDERSFRFSTPPMLLDLCLCNNKKDGSAPMDYTILTRVLNKLGNPGEEIYLAYRHGPSAGLCDIPYDTHTLEWFPHENTYEDFPLPQNELPMFCFPRGLLLKHQKRDDAPMPSYFSFVFTSIDGDRVHVGCLQFYELLPDRVLKSLEAKQRILTVVGSFSPTIAPGTSSGGGHEWDQDDSSVEEDEEGTDSDGSCSKKKRHVGRRSAKKKEEANGDEDASYGLFAPKCICIISHWPFYRALRSFLQQIYRISLSPAAVPIERYISYFTHYMPLPPPGVHALHLHLDLGLNDPVENSSLTPITLRLPDARSLSLMDLDYEASFRCLSIDNVLKVFILLLMEERLLFISSSTSQLTETTETILTLLFPFEWLSCYIPRLPNKLTEILDAPGSFLIGIYTEGSTDTWVAPQLSDPIFVVDLDHNTILDAEGKSDYIAAMEGLPMLEILREKVKAELDRTHVSVQSPEALREKDSAFELPAIPGLDTSEDVQDKLNPDVVRDAFLVFLCELIGGYTKFFNSQEGNSNSSESASNGVFGAFDVQAFLSSADKTARPLLDKLVMTQMFAALVQQRMEHSQGIDRLVFFETCVQELRERREAAEATAAAEKAGKAPKPIGGANKAGAGQQADGKSLLIHQAVASIVRRDQLAQQQQQQQQQGSAEALIVPNASPMTSPVSSPKAGGGLSGRLPGTIIIPGPGANGCGPPGTSYLYSTFPTTLNKAWMNIPPSALPPVLIEIMSKRKKYMKKGHRMILARSVSECMKDWQAIGIQIGSNAQGRNKEIYLALQIFGIYFMCLPSRVSYKGRPLKIIMQAIGILQFVLDFQLERYMDEAMWRSILVACGRCGHGSTRKIAIAIFQIMRHAGISINALTYGQYTKALAEKDALELTGSGVESRVEIDDSPWLEEKGRAWYTATCEPPAPETLKRSVADSFKSLLTRAAKPVPAEKKKQERLPLADGEVWTQDLQDPKLSAHNTTISSATLDSAGVIGMWVVCICMNCEYMPLDEEIMTLRQDLLMIQAADDHTNHLLLCPKCEHPLMPRLYYDAKTFKEAPPRCSRHAMNSCGRSSKELDKASPGSNGSGGFFAAVDSPQKRPVQRVESLSIKEPKRGEISGLGLGTTAGDHVDYLSPFTLRMRMEKLLLEHGEECLTRDWAREHHPELYWNLVWFTTRLSVPFPFLLDSLDIVLTETITSSQTPAGGGGGGGGSSSFIPPPLSKDSSNRSFRNIARQDSAERLSIYFHEIVVVGWEGEVVRNRCEKIESMLKNNSFVAKVTSSTSANSAIPSSTTASAVTGAGGPVLQSFSSFASTSSMAITESLRTQLSIGPTNQSTTQTTGEAIGPLSVEQIFPNISASELDAMNEVKKTLLAKGSPGLKDAIQQFLTLRHKHGGWTSEATLGSPYRVFLKLAANYRIKKLHNIVPVSNLVANPGLEHEYTTAVMRIGDRFLRDKVGKDEKALLAELPKRDAIKFRSVFGHLY